MLIDHQNHNVHSRFPKSIELIFDEATKYNFKTLKDNYTEEIGKLFNNVQVFTLEARGVDN